jgi:hypothetical protein
MTYYKLHMRLTPFSQRSCEGFRTEYSTPNELAEGNVRNEMNDSTIEESFFSQIILCFVSMFYSNTMTPQSQVNVLKLKVLRLSSQNLSGLECART